LFLPLVRPPWLFGDALLGVVAVSAVKASQESQSIIPKKPLMICTKPPCENYGR
jgi:hypothetical protein